MQIFNHSLNWQTSGSSIFSKVHLTQCYIMFLGSLLKYWDALIVTDPLGYQRTLGQRSPKEEELFFYFPGAS